ncbi:HoxN/HupN/NixA family nickel/cobalt transporter [Roseateles sp. GG27B]
MAMTTLLLFGFLLGMRHATDADHLAAVATVASGHQSLAQTVRQGLAWGAGHTLTLLLLGGTVLMLGKSIPSGMENALELAVACMLIALGIDVLRRWLQQQSQLRRLRQLSPVALFVRAHAEPVKPMARQVQMHRHAHGLTLRALAIGMMHGMAGTAALILLSLEAVQSVGMGLAYITVFGLGSMIGMALLSLVIALPLRLSILGQLTWLHSGVTVAVGLFSCLLGCSAAYRICSGFFLTA